MYIPSRFKVTDAAEIAGFIQENSFGTIITIEDGKPIATHIPMQFHQKHEASYITGHFAIANPQWKTMKNGKEKVLVIFQGPHAYISSTWYQHENVPTWNYQAIHVYGMPRILNDQELEEDLTALLEKYERHRSPAVLWENMSSETKKQIKGIVGFEIKIEEIQAAYKLSQNRNEVDYQQIIQQLKQENNPNAAQIAQQMEKKKNDRR
ncbi:FMN-binding negative transcriptional regulator [Ornithinibacillus gellani]|uniref:FMN-binding negative transcriptional regulator n=1 Tax=Ornithinibacillus gellani TaxID=2293253 RepID=UPI000F4AD26B|nr:FMN-binding negative transcriptional regulator [Ornithinibacillus gellani]TQS74982.1 FMN-binding negative transcriptional regulator [Ornithinibacillus gellani]